MQATLDGWMMHFFQAIIARIQMTLLLIIWQINQQRTQWWDDFDRLGKCTLWSSGLPIGGRKYSASLIIVGFRISENSVEKSGNSIEISKQNFVVFKFSDMKFHCVVRLVTVMADVSRNLPPSSGMSSLRAFTDSSGRIISDMIMQKRFEAEFTLCINLVKLCGETPGGEYGRQTTTIQFERLETYHFGSWINFETRNSTK